MIKGRHYKQIKRFIDRDRKQRFKKSHFQNLVNPINFNWWFKKGCYRVRVLVDGKIIIWKVV